MASKQEKQERTSGTKNRSTPYSEYEDPSQLKDKASNSKQDDQNRQAHNAPEKRSHYEDKDFSTINIAQLTSYEDFSPDRRTTSSEDLREVDRILFERMTILEKRMKTLENRQDAAERVNSEAKTSKPKKEDSKEKDTPTPDAIKPIKRQGRTLQSLLDELHNCYMAGRKSKANFFLSEIKKLMTSSNRHKAAEVTKMADKYIDNSSYIKAAILLSWAAELHVTDSDPDEAAREISQCSYKYDEVIGHMKNLGRKQHTIFKDFGVDISLKMLGNLRSITSVDTEVMFKYEIWTLSSVGVCHSRLGRDLDAIKFHREGMDLFERKYESKAMEHYDYGTLLHNTGVAHRNLGNNAEAEKYYLDALKSYNASNDWEYEGQKEEEILKTEKMLKRLRLDSKNE